MQRRGARISKAYKEADGYRCVVYDGQGNRSSCKAPTEAAAIEAAKAALTQILAGALTIEEVIDAYCEYLPTKGTREVTADLVKRHLLKFFGPDLNQPIAGLTADRAEELYRKLRETKMKGRQGRPLAVATQHSILSDARSMLRWCCASKRRFHPGPSPFEEVEVHGRKHRGKPQPRMDEARAWLETALHLGETFPGALAAAVALLMGLRAGEIVSRVVRDLDDGGRLLWVDGKTGPRQVEVPAVLVPRLSALIAGKAVTDPLFGFTGVKMVTWWVRKVWTEMSAERVRKGGDPIPLPADGFRRLSAHSLRGLHATLAVQAGLSAHVVAGALGHGVGMLKQNYARPGALESGAARRVEERLVN